MKLPHNSSPHDLWRIVNWFTISGVDKGGQGGGLSPSNQLKDHPCERMKSEEKLGGWGGGGGDDYV